MWGMSGETQAQQETFSEKKHLFIYTQEHKLAQILPAARHKAPRSTELADVLVTWLILSGSFFKHQMRER